MRCDGRTHWLVVVRVVLCNTLMALLLCPSLNYHTHFVKIIQYRMVVLFGTHYDDGAPSIHPSSLEVPMFGWVDVWMFGCSRAGRHCETAEVYTARLASPRLAHHRIADARTNGLSNGRTDGRTDGRFTRSTDRSLARASLRGVTNIESTKRTRATTLESTKRRSGTLEGA
jgi:hypothetical protein